MTGTLLIEATEIDQSRDFVMVLARGAHTSHFAVDFPRLVKVNFFCVHSITDWMAKSPDSFQLVRSMQQFGMFASDHLSAAIPA